MECIVHRIKLNDGVPPERFETWVREVDYATCPQLPSVLSFSVQRVSTDPAAPVHYFEVIQITDGKAFEADMAQEVFQGLEKDFHTMASVVDEVSGERVGAGYTAG